VALCEGVTEPDEAVVVAERLVEAVQSPIVIDRRYFDVGASAGVALATTPQGAEALFRRADQALRRAKARGPGSVVVADR
jgi:GGDEF domain-containing protein